MNIPTNYKELWAVIEFNSDNVEFFSKEPVWDSELVDWYGSFIIRLPSNGFAPLSTRKFIEKLFNTKLYSRKPVRLI